MSKIGKVEWILLYAIAGLIDAIQIIITFTGVGIAVSELADPIIGIVLVLYFQIRGVSMIKHPSRLISLLGIEGLETFTGGIATAWFFEIWYIHKTVRKETAEYKESEAQQLLLQNNIRRPLYDANGVRQPRNEKIESITKSLNIDGIRPPNGGIGM